MSSVVSAARPKRPTRPAAGLAACLDAARICLRGGRAERHYRLLGDCLPIPGPGGLRCASRPPHPWHPANELPTAFERRGVNTSVRHVSARWRLSACSPAPSRRRPSPQPRRTAGTCACPAARPARSTSPPPRERACRWTWRPTAPGWRSTCWATSTGFRRAGGAAESLTQESGVAVNYHPRISPDGASIAFISDRAGQDNLWVMDADGSNAQPVSTT